MIPAKIKNVLIVLDSDPTALKIAEVGFMMAKSMNAKVVLMHILNRLVTYSLDILKLDSLQVEDVKEMKTILTDFLDESVEKYGTNENQKIVKQGDFAVSLINVANEMAADIIIMGSQSSKWLEEIVMGRITNEELQLSKIPILIIPTKKHERLYTYISLEH
jgi:nucleotide-binding universal stress UspA family protein